MKKSSNRNLQILANKEIDALYALPDFDAEERYAFFTLSNDAKQMMETYRGVASRTFFILQLGYFKAKHLFFIFDFATQAADTAFVLAKYFPTSDQQLLHSITKPTRLQQRQQICKLLNYQFFSATPLSLLMTQMTVFAKRHNHSVYLFQSLLQYFRHRKIILPAYSFLQREVISPTIQAEQQRLENLMEQQLSKSEKVLIDGLLEKHLTGMYPFTLLQKEPSSFKYYQLRTQLQHLHLLQPIYEIAIKACGVMDISNENIQYYGTLAEDYKVFNLKQLTGNMRYIYLLCFAYKRYRSINDILIEGLKYHVLGLEKLADKFAVDQIYRFQLQAHTSLSKVPKVLSFLKTNDRDNTPFGAVKGEALDILSLKEIDLVTDLIHKNKPDKKVLVGIFYQLNRRLISLYLRPLGLHFDFSNTDKCKKLVKALHFVKENVTTKKSLTKLPKEDFPCGFLSKKQRKYILDKDGIIAVPKYEMALYQALKKRLEAGDIFVSDSFKNRSLEEDLIKGEKWRTDKENLLQKLDLPKLHQSATQILQEWQAVIEPLYKRVNYRIKNGLNPSVQLDGKNKDGSTKWHLIYTETSSPLNHQIYQQFSPIDIASLLQVVDIHTDFLNAFTHLFPTNVSRKTDAQQLIACLVAFGTNYGIGKMSSISDMSYSDLSHTAKTLIYLDTLQAANRKIVNATTQLPMYKNYNLQPGVVHSSSDGQKYYTQIPTINARYSPKYFGLARGISALTNVADNLLVSTEIVGANEHESHYVLDLLQRNQTKIKSDIHSTDSHGVNQVNFAILDMFGYQFAPRYKDISSKTKMIYSFQHPKIYKDYLIKPIRKFKTQLIEEEWDSFQQIIASLAMKTTAQSTIIKKLSSFKRNNSIKKAMVEYDNVVSTYHKLQYIDNPKFQKQIHTSLNRGEHINKLKKHFFHANGGKFKVHTVMEQRIWNECNRLLANATVYYNTWLLSELLAYHQKQGNVMEVDLIKKVSPIAWQHIHIHGRYTFRIGRVNLDIKEMVKKVKI